MNGLRIYVGLDRKHVAYDPECHTAIFFDGSFDFFDLFGKENVEFFDLLACSWSRGGAYKKWFFDTYHDRIKPVVGPATDLHSRDTYSLIENFFCFSNAFTKGIYRTFFLLEKISEMAKKYGKIDVFCSPGYCQALSCFRNKSNFTLTKVGTENAFKLSAFRAYIFFVMAFGL